MKAESLQLVKKDLQLENSRQGQPKTPLLSSEDAERLLRGLQPRDWSVLARSEEKNEQITVLIALAYTGDDDLTWEHARDVLADPFLFLKALYDLDGGEQLNLHNIRSADRVGRLQVDLLKTGSTAQVLALYLSACLASAKLRLRLDKPKHMPLPDDGGKAAWPVKIQVKDILKSTQKAARSGKTSLVVANGLERELDQFFRYRGYFRIDAKRVLIEMSLKKESSIDDLREDLRKTVIGAMRCNVPLHICMGTTALALSDKVCAAGTFPKTLFDPRLWNNTSVPEAGREYMTIVRPDDLEKMGTLVQVRLVRASA